MTMAWVTGVLWVVGLGLQVWLLVLLVGGRWVRQLPVFTGLVVFYSVRGVLLLGLGRVVGRSLFQQLFQGLGLLDLVLQLGVAAELWFAVTAGRTLRWQLGWLAGSVVGAVGLAAGVAWAVPGRSPMPLDRAILVTGSLFVLLACRAWRGRTEGALLNGLALTGGVGVLAQVGKSVAAGRDNGTLFMAWAYLSGGVYLLVLGWWVMQLVGERKRIALLVTRDEAGPVEG